MPLTLQVNGDIEQRIEALVSGMCWAEELGTSLEVYWWFLYPYIQCPFERCFSREKFPSWVVIRGGMVESPVVVQSEQDFVEKGYPKVLQSKRRFYEKNSEKWLWYLRLLRPSYEIQKQMSLIPSRGSIGIYIQNCGEPPVARVLAHIWQHQRDVTSFLLSADCHDSVRFLKLMFKDRLYSLNIVSKAINEKYVVDRALTFFCMSESLCILDCSRSGLMRLAAEYGGILSISL
jgi:hypothetical protein